MINSYYLTFSESHSIASILQKRAVLTLKMPRKPASENVVCLCNHKIYFRTKIPEAVLKYRHSSIALSGDMYVKIKD